MRSAAGFVLLVAATGVRVRAGAQAKPTATGPGGFLAVGVSGSGFESDYGRRSLGGGTLYVGANLYRRWGLEAEARRLAWHTDEGVRQTTYLVGPRVCLPNACSRTVRPYVKVLAGRGTFDFPFGYAKGSYLVLAAGVGLDYTPGRGRVTVRVYDFQYQEWRGFTFGALRPYGVSSGVSLRVF